MSNDDTMSPHSAFRTSPQKEFKAEDELRRAGIDAIVPIMHVRRRYGKSRVWVREKVMPGYVLSRGHLPMAEHVKRKVGTITTAEFCHLARVQARSAAETEESPQGFNVGDEAIATINGGTAAVVIRSINRRGVVVGEVLKVIQASQIKDALKVGRTFSCSVKQLRF